jgi:hypothetical protein
MKTAALPTTLGNLGRERIARSLNGEVFAVFAESASDIDSAPAR